MAISQQDFFPLSTYNTLPNIRDVFDVPKTNSDDLNFLKGLLDKYDLSSKVCIKLGSYPLQA